MDGISENEAGSYEEVQPASTPEPTPVIYETQPALLAEEVSEYAMVCEEPHEWTIEELGKIIVAAGLFWEEWWEMSGRFGSEGNEWGEWNDVPEHFPNSVYFPLLSSYWFERLYDIRSYLLRYYTESWIDMALSKEFAAFIEYNEILFIHGARAGFARPNWETATHALIEQYGSHSIVETTVKWGSWHRVQPGQSIEYAYPFERMYHFILVDDRINDIDGDIFFAP